MRRRTYLAGCTGGFALLAGCGESTGNESGDTDTARSTPTATATQTTTPTETPAPEHTPTITDVGVLREPDRYADLRRDVSGVGRGGILVIGTTVEMPVKEGSLSGVVRVSVRDSDGQRVGKQSVEIVETTGEDGQYSTQRGWVAFETADWEVGDYTAAVRAESTAFETTAGPMTRQVSVTELLGDGEGSVDVIDRPSRIVAGNRYDYSISISNETDRDTTLRDRFVATYDGEEVGKLDLPRENVTAGGQVTTALKQLGLHAPGTYTFTLERIGASFSLTVVAPE